MIFLLLVALYSVAVVMTWPGSWLAVAFGWVVLVPFGVWLRRQAE